MPEPAAIWRGPDTIGYIRVYWQTRNVQNPLYRKANRAMLRYWIRQERRKRITEGEHDHAELKNRMDGSHV